MDYETGDDRMTEENDEDVPSGIQIPCPKCGGDLQYHDDYSSTNYVCKNCGKKYDRLDKDLRMIRLEEEMNIIKSMCENNEGNLSKIFNELKSTIPVPYIGSIYSDIHLMEIKGWISERDNTLYIERNI